MDETTKLIQDILKADSEKLIRMANEINSDISHFLQGEDLPRSKGLVRDLQRNAFNSVNEGSQ